jgi:hypothetical protein
VVAEDSYPCTAHNARSVTEAEVERLLAPIGEGVLGAASDTAVAYADSSGRQAKIRAGKLVLLRGQVWDSGTAETVKSFATNTSGSTRIDRLVLRLDRSTRTVRTAILQGVAGAGVPALTRQTNTASGVYEYPILRVSLANNYTTIAPSDVTYEAMLVTDVPMARVRQTASQSLPYGTAVPINFDTDDLDRFGFHSTTTENYKIIPTAAGIYAATGWCGIIDGGSNNGFHTAHIVKNGSSSLEAYGAMQIAPINGVPTRLSASVCGIYCNGETDYLSFYVMNAVGTGGLATEIGTSYSSQPGLCVWRIADA